MHPRRFWWAGFLTAVLALLAATRLFGANADVKAKAEGESTVSDFALIDHQGAFRHLYYYAKDPKTRAIVLFVQGNGCPFVRKQVPQLKRLRDAYSTNGVIFWMMNANRQDSRGEI